jgi:predicted TIM-barrel fold metal-dependent hydrolase
MSDVLDRTEDRAAPQDAARSRLKIIDCDIHPALASREHLNAFLPKRWQEHMKTFGVHIRNPFTSTTPYPRSSPLISRRDAWPPTGGPPGSDLAFMQKQHLDPFDIEFGLLQVLDLGIPSQVNLEFGAALQRAINEWQIEFFSKPDPRLRASIVVGQDDAVAAVAEIERCAALGRHAQVNISPRANEPLGRRKYWPIYAAAEAANLPLGIHVGGYGGHVPTGSGWPSFYNEEHHSNAQTMAAQLSSLVIEGVPERFPKLKFVFIEGGFGWVPAITWRMDAHFERFRSEVPHLKRKPSEYVREHFWFTTQPMEEPDNAKHLRSMIDWIGVDRLLFSSDYPHWDFDDPRYAFKTPLSKSERAQLFNGNARAVYKFD